MHPYDPCILHPGQEKGHKSIQPHNRGLPPYFLDQDVHGLHMYMLSIAKTTWRLIIRWLLNYEAKYICLDYFSCIRISIDQYAEICGWCSDQDP